VGGGLIGFVHDRSDRTVTASGAPPHPRDVIRATVTPLASILGSGLLIIVPVLERTLGAFSIFGAIGICAIAWLVGSVIRHNVMVVEKLHTEGTLDRVTARFDRAGDAVIVIAYVISVALYLRIMAEYIVGLFESGGSPILEPIIACAAVVVIVVIGILRGFQGLDRLDRISLSTVLVLTVVLIAVLLVHAGNALATGALVLPPVATTHPLPAVLILGGLVITVQGFETVRYLGDQFDAETRVNASRIAQLVASGIYIAFVAVATPAMGIGSAEGPDTTLLNITARVAPWLAIPLVLSAVLSQFSAAIADTSAADGNLRGLSRWFTGPRPYLISGAAAIILAATVPTLVIVTVASRAFAAYYGIQAIIALRTSRVWWRRAGYALLALLMFAITLFALPAG
jgi:hypothetical protein